MQMILLLMTALLAGLARGFSGFGGALIFMPVASAIVGPRLAAPLLLLVDGVAALGLIPEAWRRADKTDVGIMTLGAIVGVPAGTAILTRFDALTMRWGMTALVMGMLILLMSGWRYGGRPMPVLTACIGCMAGFCSGAAQIGGPPVVTYWLGGTSPGGTVRANVILYFAVSTALTTTTYIASGLITGRVLGLAIIVGPLYGLGLWAGSQLFGLAKEKTFRRICLSLIVCAAIASLPLLDGHLH